MEIKKVAGQKVSGSLMARWLDLRDRHPQYFEEIIVMQQPSATVDEVIVGWSLADLRSRFPQVMLQRDLLSGALASRARVASYLSGVLECWIGPGMTVVMQITDTDVAFVLKRLLAKFKMQITRTMKDEALQEGQAVVFKMGPAEIMEVVYKSVMEFKESIDKGDLTLQALRRNGQLAYICRGSKLVKLTKDIAAWVEDLGEIGSHRYPQTWVEDRYSWLDEKGVPLKAEWLDALTMAEQTEVNTQMQDLEKGKVRISP